MVQPGEVTDLKDQQVTLGTEAELDLFSGDSLRLKRKDECGEPRKLTRVEARPPALSDRQRRFDGSGSGGIEDDLRGSRIQLRPLSSPVSDRTQ